MPYATTPPLFTDADVVDVALDMRHAKRAFGLLNAFSGGIADDLVKAEQAAGLPETRVPEAGFAAIAYAWAAGHQLEDLFDDDFAAGDFVRNCRQLIDVMRQLRDEFPALRRAAAEAITRVDRGVVAAGGRA